MQVGEGLECQAELVCRIRGRVLVINACGCGDNRR